MPLPLIHKVRDTLVPTATTAHVAEMMISDLVTVEATADGNVELRFTAEAADQFRAHLAIFNDLRLQRLLAQ